MNQIAERLAGEIRYPLPTPVSPVPRSGTSTRTPISGSSVCPWPRGRFLLHLPDLYHELAHSLLEFEDDARLADFQELHVEAVSEAHGYLACELHKEDAGLVQRP